MIEATDRRPALVAELRAARAEVERLRERDATLDAAATALVCAREDVPKEVCRLVERQTRDILELAALHKIMDALPTCGTCDCTYKATKYWESQGLVRFCCDACAPASARQLSYAEALRALQEKK